jgi:hypothetical protein
MDIQICNLELDHVSSYKNDLPLTQYFKFRRVQFSETYNAIEIENRVSPQ